ncbi:MAG: NAD-dependent epimerase/dehydratase family protein [Desulfobacterales bacterium]|nr:MAG: NAD-dependent epimerase/dehydratase family protein [Desulfobacterales bacterium]
MRPKEFHNQSAFQKVLVTGGGGFLGRAIVNRLAAQGLEVRSFSRGFYPELAALGVELIQGDIGNRDAVQQACQGVDLVIHTAAKPPPWGKYKDYFQTNVTGTQNVLEACDAQGVSRLVYTSSPSVVFDGTDLEGVDESIPYPKSYNAYYPQTKALAERQVRAADRRGLQTITLRPHQIWGPGDPHFVPRLIARAKRLKRIGNGRNRVDTTYIDNAADAHILAAEKLAEHPELSGNIYFISQGEPIAAWDMINAILHAAKLDPVNGSIPHRAAWLVGAGLELIYQALRLSREPPMTRFLVDALAKAHWFDISAARNDLGYVPRVSTEEGLQHLERWLDNKHAQGENV